MVTVSAGNAWAAVNRRTRSDAFPFAVCIALFLLVCQVSYASERNSIASGSFTSGITSGSVLVRETGGQWVVTFGEDFVHDGSPDPWIAFGRDGFQRHGIIGKLNQLSGSQSHLVGPKLHPPDFNEVYIWCVEHNTSLGRARIIWNE
ncbi:MAG: hypothetical protein AAF423_04625 [Pseudomonadota bacterium]